MMKILQDAPWSLPQLLPPPPYIFGLVWFWLGFSCYSDLLSLSMPGLHSKSVVMEIWASAPGGRCASLSHPSDKSWANMEHGPQQYLPATWSLLAPPGKHLVSVMQGDKPWIVKNPGFFQISLQICKLIAGGHPLAGCTAAALLYWNNKARRAVFITIMSLGGSEEDEVAATLPWYSHCQGTEDEWHCKIMSQLTVKFSFFLFSLNCRISDW